MKWDEHLANVRLSQDLRGLIVTLKAPALQKEAGYYALKKVTWDYIRCGMAIRWNHNNQLHI
jgi:hypothetical protein